MPIKQAGGGDPTQPAGRGQAANPMELTFPALGDTATMMIRNAHHPTGDADSFTVLMGYATKRQTEGFTPPEKQFPRPRATGSPAHYLGHTVHGQVGPHAKPLAGSGGNPLEHKTKDMKRVGRLLKTTS
ncbi:MAG: hypothetical protein B6230_03120 [Desulfobacteraceae bacterium 4572_89]|nr:MAG: hypothetical protein B6230_03120 [Desulfobacteraceae bacterium 4572_89]